MTNVSGMMLHFIVIPAKAGIQGRLTTFPVTGFTAGFFEQAHITDHHAAIDCLAHIVNRQQAYLYPG
jgi:hypothetical protein